MKPLPVTMKPHYWIYKEGKTVWNTWVNSAPTVSLDNCKAIIDHVLKRILKNISENCPVVQLLPKPEDQINFYKSKWDERAEFQGYEFKTQLVFEGSEFEKGCDFTEAEFQHRALFAQTKFKGQASFMNSKVMMLMSFYRSEFEEVPFINGIDINGIINLDGIDWPRSPKVEKGLTNKKRDTKYKKISNIKNAYCYLKAVMNDHHIHDMEMEFFRLELEAKSRLETTRPVTKMLIGLYWLTSDYGDSVVRPFICLLFSLPFFGVLYMSFSEVHEWLTALHISLANFLPFVTPNKLLDTGVINLLCLSEWEKFVFNFLRGMQITFSILFIFLMGLGLRNTLRLR